VVENSKPDVDPYTVFQEFLLNCRRFQFHPTFEQLVSKRKYGVYEFKTNTLLGLNEFLCHEGKYWDRIIICHPDSLEILKTNLLKHYERSNDSCC